MMRRSPYCSKFHAIRLIEKIQVAKCPNRESICLYKQRLSLMAIRRVWRAHVLAPLNRLLASVDGKPFLTHLGLIRDSIRAGFTLYFLQTHQWQRCSKQLAWIEDSPTRSSIILKGRGNVIGQILILIDSSLV